MHYRATTGIGFPRQAAGLSIVELMIALTLLALVSIAGLPSMAAVEAVCGFRRRISPTAVKGMICTVFAATM